MANNEKQLTGMAGEYLTLGKLFKKRLQAAVTVGNAKSVDILAYNDANNKNYNVQVKTLRQKNCFLIDDKSINASHIYVFVILHEFETAEDYYIIKGAEILKNIDKFFGPTDKPEKKSQMTGITYGRLKEYKDNWALFDK